MEWPKTFNELTGIKNPTFDFILYTNSDYDNASHASLCETIRLTHRLVKTELYCYREFKLRYLKNLKLFSIE